MVVDLHDASDIPLEYSWPFVAEDVEAAAKHSDGELDPEEVRYALERKQASLWLVFSEGAYRGVVVTELCGNAVNLVLIRLRYTGREAFGQVLGFLRRWAVDEYGPGTRLVGSSRRPGMGRLLARYGWTPRFVEYVSP